MKKLFCILFSLASIILFNNCASMKAPIIKYFDTPSIKDYTYVYITPTQELSSSTGVYGGQYGVYGGTTKTINPSDVISGILLKNGFVRVNEVIPENASKTLIVNYGESGRRTVNLGYSIEVTIQFINAKTQQPVVVCTAEGQGSTEADDIRVAINRALEPLFK